MDLKSQIVPHFMAKIVSCRVNCPRFLDRTILLYEFLALRLIKLKFFASKWIPCSHTWATKVENSDVAYNANLTSPFLEFRKNLFEHTI